MGGAELNNSHRPNLIDRLFFGDAIGGEIRQTKDGSHEGAICGGLSIDGYNILIAR
jgi:hypothetical protein